MITMFSLQGCRSLIGYFFFTAMMKEQADNAIVRMNPGRYPHMNIVLIESPLPAATI